MDLDRLLDKDTVLAAIIMGFALKGLVFFLGFVTVRMGYTLIREGVKGSFKFTTEAKGLKGALQSSSPGLLFVVLGVFVMGFSMFQHKGVQLFEDAIGKSNPTKTEETTDGANSDSTTTVAPAMENQQQEEETVPQDYQPETDADGNEMHP